MPKKPGKSKRKAERNAPRTQEAKRAGRILAPVPGSRGGKPLKTPYGPIRNKPQLAGGPGDSEIFTKDMIHKAVSHTRARRDATAVKPTKKRKK